MTTTYANEYSALSPFVTLIQQIVDQSISESGVGASSFGGLSDKTTANLPALNSPLAAALAALASKSTADAHYADTGNPHSTNLVQLGGQAALVSGSNIKTIGGQSLLGSGDLAVVGATSLSALTDKTTYDLPANNTPLAAALAAKASVFTTVTIGTGGIALSASANANRTNVWTGSTPQTVTIDTTGGVVDDLYILANQGTADVTMPGTAGAGYSLTVAPNTIGCVQWRGGSTFLSWIPSVTGVAVVDNLTSTSSTNALSAKQGKVLSDLLAAVAPPVTVTGSTVNGSVLTRTLGTGWSESAGNWTRDGTNISGATSPTYTTGAPDGTHLVTWKSTTIPYAPTGIAVAAAIVGTPYATEVMADSPTIYLRLNETTGTTAADSSGNSKPGTISGGVTLNQSPVFAGGSAAMVFNGTSGAVSTSLLPLTASYNGPFSMEASFKLSATPSATNTISNIGGTGDTAAQLSVRSDGSIRFTMVTNNPTALIAQTAAAYVVVGTAYHVVGTIARAGTLWTAKLYVNGSLIDTQTLTDSNTTRTIASGVGLTAGWGGSGSNYFAGTVDEVAAYSTELTGARITAHYAARATP